MRQAAKDFRGSARARSHWKGEENASPIGVTHIQHTHIRCGRPSLIIFFFRSLRFCSALCYPPFSLQSVYGRAKRNIFRSRSKRANRACASRGSCKIARKKFTVASSADIALNCKSLREIRKENRFAIWYSFDNMPNIRQQYGEIRLAAFFSNTEIKIDTNKRLIKFS